MKAQLTMPALIIVIAVGALAFAIARHLQKSARTPGSPKLTMESDFIVEISDSAVTCKRPDGKSESVKWDDLQQVKILTTDAGPFAPDIFWVLYGSTTGCVIPWGATGDAELLDRLQALPGFRNDAIIDASSLTTNGELLCWERTQPAD